MRLPDADEHLRNIITAATNANLTGVGQIGNNIIDAGETATLAGKAPGVGGVVDLMNDTVLAKNIVANLNIQNVSGGTYTSTEKTTMTADMEISGVTVRAGGEAALTTVNRDIVNSRIEGAPVVLNAARHIANVSVDSETTATLTAKNDISGTDVKAIGNIEITATEGTIQGVTALGKAAITLKAKTEIDGSDFTATGNIGITATDLAASSFIRPKPARSRSGTVPISSTSTNLGESRAW